MTLWFASEWGVFLDVQADRAVIAELACRKVCSGIYGLAMCTDGAGCGCHQAWPWRRTRYAHGTGRFATVPRGRLLLEGCSYSGMGNNFVVFRHGCVILARLSDVSAFYGAHKARKYLGDLC